MNEKLLMATLVEKHHKVYLAHQNLGSKLRGLEEALSLLRLPGFDLDRKLVIPPKVLLKNNPSFYKSWTHTSVADALALGLTPWQIKTYFKWARLCSKYRRLDREKRDLKAALKVLAKVFSIHLYWGTDGRYACDRLTSLRSDGRLYTRAEFIKEVTFAEMLLGSPE